MASEAQVRANRLNAQKSAGPRTAEGKAIAAQNSLKHGLFAREGVIRGEDREEYDMHREMLLEQLDPAGPLEAILAARVVDLSWRLRRAAQDQNETFGALYDKCVAREVAGPEAGAGGGTGLAGAGAPPSKDGPEVLTTRGQSLPPTQSGDGRDTDTPGERGALLGRMILEDFEQEAVLERLLRYERRIESSFYRTLNELRRVHDQGRQADQEVVGTLGRWRQEDGEARKARAFACERPLNVSPELAGATTNTPGDQVGPASEIPAPVFTNPVPDSPAEDETCKTNPISRAREPSRELVGSGLLTPITDSQGAHPYLPGGSVKRSLAMVFSGTPERAIPKACGFEAATRPEDETCKTNPIGKFQVSSLKFEVSDQKEHMPSPLTSNFTLPTSNSPPNASVGGVACKTNPISPDPEEGLAAWG